MDDLPTLSRAIQELGLASDSQLEEAWARQVIYGGELDLNILELGMIDEAGLSDALGMANGLPTVAPGPLPIDVDLTRKLAAAEVPAAAGRTVEGHGCLFVEIPLSGDTRQKAEEIVGTAAQQFSAVGVRIREALAFAKGESLSPRAARLVDHLGPLIEVAEPAEHDASPLQQEEPHQHQQEEPQEEPQEESHEDEREESHEDEREEPQVQQEPAPAPDASAAIPRDAPVSEQSSPEDFPQFPGDIPTPGSIEVSEEQENTAPPPGDYEGITRRSQIPPPRTSVPPKTRVVTYSLEAARTDLETAEGRDAVIDILVTFAEQFFEYVAVFAIQAKEARGLAASGPGATTEQLPNLRIPLDLPSAFSKAKETGQHGSARIRASGLEGGVARDLGRPTGRSILLLPVQLKNRPVLLVWGDQGEEDATPEQIAPVLALADGISQALERILRELKASRMAAPPQAAAMPPVDVADKPPTANKAQKNEPGPSTASRNPSDSALPHEARSDEDLTRRRTSLSLPHIKQPAYQPGRPGFASDSPPERGPPPELEQPRMAHPPPAAPPPPTESEDVTKGSRRREPTQRNLAAPEAGQRDWSDTTEVSGPNPKGENAQGRSDGQSESAEGMHSVAPAERRALNEPQTGIVTRLPSETPRTLKGFPNRASAPATKPIKASPAPQVASPLLSRRIVPVSDPPQPPGGNAPVRRVAEAPVPEVARANPAKANPAKANPAKMEQAPGGTLVSRRPSMMDEPPEDGWDAPPPRRHKGARPAEVHDALIDELLAGDESVLDQLVDGGEAAVGSLISRFPGPIEEPQNPTMPASQCGPILKALAHVGKQAVPFLTVRTADADASVRRWATYLLGELKGKEAARAIARRLLDDSPEVRRAALASARQARSDTITRRTLRAQVEEMIRDPGLDKAERALAIEALADIREHEAIPTLLQLLEDPETTIARSCRWALGVLTRQDFGDNAAAWREFWQDHRDEDRVEWLILALDHEREDLRRAALEELRLLSGQTFGYSPSLAPGPRRRIQSQFRAWWNEQSKN